MKIGKFMSDIKEQAMLRPLDRKHQYTTFFYRRLHNGVWTLICNNIRNRIVTDFLMYENR